MKIEWDEIDREAVSEGAALKRLQAYQPKKHKRTTGKIEQEKELDLLKLLNITCAHSP